MIQQKLSGVAVILALSLATKVIAQPPATQAPTGANAAAQPQLSEKQTQKQRDRAEREAMQKEWPRQVMRDFLAKNGFTAKELQEAVLAHMEQRQERSRKVRESGNKLQSLMVQADLPATQVAVATNEYKAALEDYAAAHQTAEASLDAKINYSKDPRLEATLLLAGVLGEGPSFVNAGAPPWSGGGKKGNGKNGKGGGQAQVQNAP